LLAAGAGLSEHRGETAMIGAALLRKYSAQSHPFTLLLADGRKIRVPHGDHLSVQPAGRVFLRQLD
jgi:hypothetical protein